jgi:outer membrane protein OmpA-like peptidoglycan-associated protein
MIMLPNGVRYKENSATLDGEPLAEPKKYDEQTLLFSLNDPGKDWSHLLDFEGWITKDAKPGEMVTRSVAMFNAPSENNQRTPVALTSALLAIVPSDKRTHKPEEAPKFSSFNPELSDADKRALIPILDTLKGLTDLKLEVIGHTDSVPIASRSRHIFQNNTQLSLARARSTGNFLAQQLGLNPDQVTIAGQGSKKPIARNSTTEDRAKNRRVEVNILSGNNGMSIARADSGDQ